jgi:hypothetical protein
MDILWVVAAILLVMWVGGFAMSYTMGGLLHILLVLAVIAVIVRLVSGSRPRLA